MFHDPDLSHFESLSVTCFACSVPDTEQHFDAAAQMSYRARQNWTEPDENQFLFHRSGSGTPFIHSRPAKNASENG
jgi:hypothetical protein